MLPSFGGKKLCSSDNRIIFLFVFQLERIKKCDSWLSTTSRNVYSQPIKNQRSRLKQKSFLFSYLYICHGNKKNRLHIKSKYKVGKITSKIYMHKEYGVSYGKKTFPIHFPPHGLRFFFNKIVSTTENYRKVSSVKIKLIQPLGECFWFQYMKLFVN